jgi:hypothetical protein
MNRIRTIVLTAILAALLASTAHAANSLAWDSVSLAAEVDADRVLDCLVLRERANSLPQTIGSRGGKINSEPRQKAEDRYPAKGCEEILNRRLVELTDSGSD